MHQGFAADAIAFDRRTASERCRSTDDVFMDLWPWRISAHDELLILQGFPMDRVAIGKNMVFGQSREDLRIPTKAATDSNLIAATVPT